MAKPREQLETDIADFLAFGGRVVPGGAASLATKQLRRMPAAPSMAKERPSTTEETKITVPSSSGRKFYFVLRPAELYRANHPNGRAAHRAILANRTEHTWLVSTRDEVHLGILLDNGNERRRWTVRRFERATSRIDGITVINRGLVGATWHEALMKGAEAWWAP